MTKKKLMMILSLPILMLLMIGCEINQTKSSSGSGSGSSSQDQEAHGQATINLMERNVFSGANLDPAFWSWLEGYCKAGPTHLIIADMGLVPGQFSRSIGTGYWASQMFALASTYAGVNWSPPGDPDADYYYSIRDQIFEWWERYISAILRIMQNAPQTTALIVINDEPDRCGARLGYAIQSRLASLNNRVELGQVLDHWR